MGVRVGDQFLVRDGVPGVQDRELGQQPHGAPVGADRVLGGLAAGVLVGARLPPGQHQGGREPLQVPLPGAVHRLVEVVEVDDQTAAGVAVQAEVGRVRVAAQLRADPGHGGARQVVRHEAGRTAQEGEGGGRHPAHPYRCQLGYAARVGLLHRADRVRAGAVQVEGAVRAARHARPERLALLLGRARRRPVGESAYPGQPARHRPLRRFHTSLGHRDRLPRTPARTKIDSNINSCRPYR